jgi:hypothetical protein
METIIGVAAIIVSVALYFAGVRQGKRQEREQREHELALETERREHELALERERQRHERAIEVARVERELISKVVDEYVGMSRRRYDSGPHALATLGLEQLGGDSQIRDALREMAVRAGVADDPWAGQAGEVKDIDLLAFFRYVRENRVDFFKQSVAEVAAAVREEGGVRRV